MSRDQGPPFSRRSTLSSGWVRGGSNVRVRRVWAAAWVAAPIFLILGAPMSASAEEGDIRVGFFEVDASPPPGSPLAYDPVKATESPLSCRGLVIAGAGDAPDRPIVLVALDWIGVSNGGQTAFKEAIAAAVGTDPLRVAVHTLHQHDAPRCDFAAEALLAEHGAGGAGFNPEHARSVVKAAAAAAREALARAVPVDQVGLGAAKVEKVASNRRILGPDGKVMATRYTATKDPEIRALPVGTIDPELKMLSFWQGDRGVAALTWYATHPQSYYRTGLSNPDFPGLARNRRQEETGVPHLHFNGAGGNVGAGKWNDGSRENRRVLADRVAAGMEAAWKATRKSPLRAGEVAWETVPVRLPRGAHLDETALQSTVADRLAPPPNRYSAAEDLVWLRRGRAGEAIPVGCLRAGSARVLHLPGELFVEYQLAAQKMRPDLFVALAAYGDYAPGYIGTEEAYGQGGYETSARASQVAPEVEGVLLGAMRKLLGAP